MLRLTAFTKSIDMWVFYKTEIVIRWISCTICTISNFLSYYIRENGLLLSPSLLIIDTTPILKNNLLILHHLFSIRSEEHKSELQSLMSISYAVFFLKKHNT